MRHTRQRDTAFEVAVRSGLHQRGLRFRVDRSPTPLSKSRADIVFGSARIAVYLDGCYWHQCPLHGTTPKRNRDWWSAKLTANRERDAAAVSVLEGAGWVALRFWEHEDVAEVVAAIREAVLARKGPNRA